MDDFLHNLRSGKLKHPDRGRRDYTDYKGPQRRAGNERRRPDYYAKVTGENFALVKDSLDLLAEKQARIADAIVEGEKAGIRIADALEAIVEMMKGHLVHGRLLSPSSQPAEEIPSKDTMESIAPGNTQNVRPGNSNEKLGNGDKPEMLDIIASMRADGNSWEKIARHMDDQHFPTVSGKGKWRGPAIKKFWEANA